MRARVLEQTGTSPSCDRLPEVVVVDVFCGVGGLTHGFVQEGMQVVAGLDSDASCRFAYEHNNGARFLCEDIEQIQAADVLNLYPNGCLKILVGCAPCQPFSNYTQKKEKTGEHWRLLSVFADLIDEVRPDIVSMENVPELRTFHEGEVYGEFVERLEASYSVTDYVAYCPNYGVPQKRNRLVLFASRFGDVELIGVTHT